jgi:large subunit ribosomal protein L24
VQTTLLGIAIALILALLAALIGPHLISWNGHRAFFEAEASRLIGLEVKVGGDIDATLLPLPAVTLGDIAIGAAGEASRMRADSLRIELGLGSLMRGEFRATEMKLAAPQLQIGLDAQGQIDWPPVTLAAETLSIDRLSIEDGRATLTDAASGSQLVLDELRFTGGIRSLAGPIRGSGEFVSQGGHYSYDLSAGRSGPDGTRVRFSLKTDERPLTFEAEGMLGFDDATPRFEGTLTLGRPAVAVLASGKAVATEPWRLTSKIKAGPAAAALEEVSFQYGPDERALTLAGSAEFGFGKYPLMRGKLSARQIDLDRLLATSGMPRRLPLAAVQAFGEMLGSAERPAWPVQLAVKVDAMTIGGGTVQGVAAELRSDGHAWAVDRLQLRAPGSTHINLDGRLFALGKGLGFIGGGAIDSTDPNNLMAWVGGTPANTAATKPWQAIGDITLNAGRIAIERLQTQIERSTVEGDIIYAWPVDGRPARIEADLRVAELDLDTAASLWQSAQSGLGLERPGEAKLSLEAGRAVYAGIEAHKVAARLTVDPDGVAIERLSVGDLVNMSLLGTGRIQTRPAGGNVTLYLDARDLNGAVALSEKFAPGLTEPLQKLSARQKTATLQAAVSFGGSNADAVTGKADITGQLGAVRVNMQASATGQRQAFSVTDLGALAGADLKLKGRLESDESGPLLAMLGLERLIAAQPSPAQLRFSSSGVVARELRFEGKFDASSIAAEGSGAIRRTGDRNTVVAVDRFAGTVGGSTVQGGLSFTMAEKTRVNGTIEAEALDAPAILAAVIGMRPSQKAGAADWPTEPFAWHGSDLVGRLDLKSKRVTLLPGVVAQQLRGAARFNGSELILEDVTGELANGRLEARLALTNGPEGAGARLRVGLSEADAAALFPGKGGPAISGKLELLTELEASGRSPAAFMGSLAGFGSITLQKAQLAGLNPAVFDATIRAAELGIPLGGARIREFATGVLDGAPLSVARATSTIRISAGQARFNNIKIQAKDADVQASASIDLSNAMVDAALTLSGTQPTGGAPPAVLIVLKGRLPSPARMIDASLLSGWLTLREVEQQTKQIDSMEQAAREAAAREQAAREAAREAAGRQRQDAPSATADAPDNTNSDAAARMPALPPPIDIPAVPASPIAPRADGGAPVRSSP